MSTTSGSEQSWANSSVCSSLLGRVLQAVFGMYEHGRTGCTLCLLFLPQSWMEAPHTCIPVPRRAYTSEQWNCCQECGLPDLVRVRSAFLNLNRSQYLGCAKVAPIPAGDTAREAPCLTFRIYSLATLPSPTCPTPAPPFSRRCSP